MDLAGSRSWKERTARHEVPAFEPSGFFALRTPLLPFDEFLRWADGLSSTAVVDDAPALEAALAADRDLQRRRLRDLVARPDVREALFLASPDLDAAIPRWLEAPESERGQRAERALVKYFSRMAGRATPFGLFAGTSAGRIGDVTRLVLDESHTIQRHSRLDSDFLFAVADAIARDRVLREGLPLRPNSTLYESRDRLRYVEVRLDGKERTYHLVSVESAPHHSETLARSASGARRAELAEALVDAETSPDEAAAYIDELVDAQLLVPDTGLVVTGPEPATAMAERLADNPATAGVSAALREACRELDALDAYGIGNAPERYRSLAAARLSSLPARPELPRLFQVDLVKSSPEAVVGKAVLDEIRRGVKLLWRLGAGENSLLEAFRLAFVERYEEREIPLVEALDDESGIGFPPHPEDGTEGAPLLKGLAFPGTGGSLSWGGRESFLLRKVSEAVARGETEIVLDDKQVDTLAAREPRPLPGAFAAMVQVASASDDALAKGRFQVLLDWAGGPSGARLLGRFCHWNARFESLVQEHLRKEEELEPEAIFAEVIHLPDARAGNVLLRPVLRAYEIPFLGASGAVEDRQLPVTDLMVSVVGEEIRLRSRRLGRRIVPRLTTAHNYGSFGLGLYRFLCQLQGQGVASGLGWSWGPLAGTPFLPRIRHGRTILSRARWTADREELEKLTKGRGAESFRAVAAWRKSRRLPRHVVLSEGDNGLPIDLEAPLSVDAFLHLVKRRGFIELTEMFPGPDELCVRGPEGRFVHELLIPFVRTAESRGGVPELGGKAAAAPPSQPATAPSRRSFAPGSEWLYAKLYAGAATSEKVLLEDLAPLAREAVADGAADRWFFVRYADPRPHLRFRLHGDPRRLREEVLPSLQQAVAPLLASGRVWRMQLDTYDREIERYGGAEGMDVSEAIFAKDSETAVEILGMLEEGEAGHEERWRLALLGADALLDDFGFSLGEKSRIVGTARKSLAEEQREGPLLKRSLGERFRKESSGLERLVERVEPGGPLAPGIQAISARSRSLERSCASLRQMEREGRLQRPLADLAASFVHMYLNRLFRSAQRRQELVVYDFLVRLYASRRARVGAELGRDEQRTTG